eukprot:scaffold12953_cov96-Isochrysis_galbana.AAC.5
MGAVAAEIGVSVSMPRVGDVAVPHRIVETLQVTPKRRRHNGRELRRVVLRQPGTRVPHVRRAQRVGAAVVGRSVEAAAFPALVLRGVGKPQFPDERRVPAAHLLELVDARVAPDAVPARRVAEVA